jgi:hypothetical protein
VTSGDTNCPPEKEDPLYTEIQQPLLVPSQTVPRIWADLKKNVNGRDFRSEDEFFATLQKE